MRLISAVFFVITGFMTITAAFAPAAERGSIPPALFIAIMFVSMAALFTLAMVLFNPKRDVSDEKDQRDNGTALSKSSGEGPLQR